MRIPLPHDDPEDAQGTHPGRPLPEIRPTAAGYPLGIRTNRQRTAYAAGTLTGLRVQRLEGLGMVWNPTDAAFDDGLAAARAYYADHGTLAAPRTPTALDRPVGQWLSNQRRPGAHTDHPGRAEALAAIDPDWNPAWQRTHRQHEAMSTQPHRISESPGGRCCITADRETARAMSVATPAPAVGHPDPPSSTVITSPSHTRRRHMTPPPPRKRRRRKQRALQRELADALGEAVSRAGLSHQQIAIALRHKGFHRDRSTISRVIAGHPTSPALLEDLASLLGADIEQVSGLGTQIADLEREIRAARRVWSARHAIRTHPPSGMTSHTDLLTALADHLKRHRLSHREIARRTGHPRATIGAALRGERALRADLLADILRASHADHASTAAWMRMWHAHSLPDLKTRQQRRHSGLVRLRHAQRTPTA